MSEEALSALLHEDRRFEGSDDKVKQGFLIARDVLRPYCH